MENKLSLKKCPDCGGELEEGAVMDLTYGGIAIERYGKTTVPKAQQQFKFFSEADFQDIRRVISYRCTKCNRLFSYAQDFTLGKNIWSTRKSKWIYVILLLAIVIPIIVFFITGIWARNLITTP